MERAWLGLGMLVVVGWFDECARERCDTVAAFRVGVERQTGRRHGSTAPLLLGSIIAGLRGAVKPLGV